MRNAAMLLLLSTPAFAAVKNFVMIAVDDLRPLFGDAFANPEVLAPNIDRHFLRGGGSAFQHSYVQIAVCGPSRSSILTGRRPDTTTVGVQPGGPLTWCWCQRGKCRDDGLFMTLPAWFARNGYVTAGNGKIFHPDACSTRMGRQHNYGPAFEHISGDDARGWNVPPYGVEGMFEEPFDNATNQFAEEQFGTIPGPNEAIWNNTMGPSWLMSPLADEQQTDGQIATNTISRLTNFSRAGIGKTSGKPFFLATGFHKPHTPYIVPEKYFRLYDLENVSLAPNRFVPKGFKEENWHANGNVEIKQFKNPGAVNEPFAPAVFGFNTPVDNQTARELRRAYFAATSFLDAQVGRVMAAIDDLGFASNTAVALWSDHG